MNKIYFILCLLVTFGCAEQVAQTTLGALPGSIESKLVLSGALKYTKVVDLRMDNRGSFLKVNAEIYNTSNTDDYIYYRFRWLNVSGIPVGSEEAWKTIPIRPQSSQNITGVSTSKEAIDFKLELNSPYNTGVN